MNSTLRNTLTVLAVMVLAAAIFFAGTWYAHVNAFGPYNMMGAGGDSFNNDPYFRGRPGGYGGMMSGNNQGRGMMNNNAYGRGMMNGYNNASLVPITVDQAKAAAENYLAKLNNSDLEISEIMVFDNNAYILVKEVGTGKGAFELLADSSSQTAYPEHGPNMMWNLKYGGINRQNMMGGRGGMMNGYNWEYTIPAEVSADMSVTPENAIAYAQAYLDANLAGATAADDPTRFYGYYTLDYEINGKVAGMLSVNGYSGQVFLHTWHGPFIEESAVQ